jgi:hypothetical protein
VISSGADDYLVKPFAYEELVARVRPSCAGRRRAIALGVLWRRRWARRAAITLELLCLIGSLLSLVLPIGANHGPVALMVNAAIPIALVVVLSKRLA